MMTKLKSQRLSAVSTIIQGISDSGLATESNIQFHFAIADNLFHRLNAFRLGYTEYIKKGYIDENEYKVLINALDIDVDTLTIVAYHGNREVGTLTVNTQNLLPFQEIFDCPEIHQEGFKGAELTRLAIDEEFRNQKEILLGLFNIAFAYAKFVRKCSHFVIEVNPRHVKFYEKFLGFVPVAENSNCPRVRGAPAVLLLGDLELALAFPENYPFLSVGKDREELISIIENTQNLSSKEVQILQRIHSEIRAPKHEKIYQFANV